MLALRDVSDYTRILVAQLQGILLAYGNSETEFNAEVCSSNIQYFWSNTQFLFV